MSYLSDRVYAYAYMGMLNNLYFNLVHVIKNASLEEEDEFLAHCNFPPRIFIYYSKMDGEKFRLKETARSKQRNTS